MSRDSGRAGPKAQKVGDREAQEVGGLNAVRRRTDNALEQSQSTQHQGFDVVMGAGKAYGPFLSSNINPSVFYRGA